MVLRIFTTRPRTSGSDHKGSAPRSWKNLWRRSAGNSVDKAIPVVVVEQERQASSGVVEVVARRQSRFSINGSSTLRQSEGHANDDVKSVSSSFMRTLRHRWSNLSSREKSRPSQDRPLSKKRSIPDGISQVQKQGFSSCPCNKALDHHPDVVMKADFRGTPKLVFNFLFPNSFVRFFVNENPHVLGRRDSNWTQDDEIHVLARTSSYVQLLSGTVGPKAVMCHTRDVLLHETVDYIVVATSKRMFDTSGNFTMTIALKTCITWASPSSASVLVTMRQKQYEANGLEEHWPLMCSKSELDCYREIERALQISCAREFEDVDFMMEDSPEQGQSGNASVRRRTLPDASPTISRHPRMASSSSINVESLHLRRESTSMGTVVPDYPLSHSAPLPRRVVEEGGGIIEEIDDDLETCESMEGTAESAGSMDLQTVLGRWAHLDLGKCVRVMSANPVAHGGYADVFMGYSTKHMKKVAIKRIRIHLPGRSSFAKKVAKEIQIWSKLQHPNVHPLLGYVIEGEHPSFISEWMDNGPLRSYMTKLSPGETLTMVHGIARGLAYLHFHGVIHSDLKADNVLVSPSGEALLTDFGISSIIESTLTMEFGSDSNGMRGSSRWLAEELLRFSEGSEASRHTMESDVWAFGMTVYELLTHERPYFHIKIEAQVILAIAQGARPIRPASPWFKSLEPFGTFLWLICQSCWFKDPAKRLTMLDVIRELDSATFSDSKHPLMLDRLRNALAEADDARGEELSERPKQAALDEGTQELSDWLFYSSSY